MQKYNIFDLKLLRNTGNFAKSVSKSEQIWLNPVYAFLLNLLIYPQSSGS
jgi:hypothetical protein